MRLRPVRPRRAARQLARGLRELPCAVGLDVGAHGAHARPRDPRTGRAWPSGLPTSSRSRSAGRAIPRRWCATSPTCATASPATRRPRARGTSSTCPAACSISTSSPSTWRCATPPSGPTCSIPIPPRCCAAPPRPGFIDADRRRAAARRPHAALRCAEPAAAHPERRRGGVRRDQGAGGPAPPHRRDRGRRDLAELRARIEAETAGGACYIPPHRRGAGACRRLAAPQRRQEERRMSVEEGKKAPDFTAADRRRQEAEAVGAARQAGGALLLSKGRHARAAPPRPAAFAIPCPTSASSRRR